MAEKAVDKDKIVEIDSTRAEMEPKIEVSEEKQGKIAQTSEIEGIEQLKASLRAKDEELATAKRLQIEAEQARLAAERRAFSAGNEVQDSNLRTIQTGMEVLKANAANLKASYKEAMRAGDLDQVAEINEQIADNRAKYLQLENGQQALKERPRDAPPEHSDLVEATISRMGIRGRSADWVRAHPIFVQDNRKLNAMIGAHNIAMSKGIPADTDEYFSEVERTLGLERRAALEEEEDDPLTQAAQPVARRSSPASAPVSRSGTSPDVRPRTVRLTQQEAEIAAATKLTPEEYWKLKQKAIANGEITRH